YSILKQQQVEVIDPALIKLDCLVVMSTGGGKSTCFLLPGLVERDVTFVVSPLKSLMFDQVNYLNSLGVIKMNHHFNYMWNLLKCLKTLIEVGDRKKLQKLMMILDQKGYLLRFVIDEAHCICSCGTEFR
ncbi:hypothetical protein DAPPUDRAFT_12263, partial [Daphnia pulex]